MSVPSAPAVRLPDRRAPPQHGFSVNRTSPQNPVDTQLPPASTTDVERVQLESERLHSLARPLSTGQPSTDDGVLTTRPSARSPSRGSRTAADGDRHQHTTTAGEDEVSLFRVAGGFAATIGPCALTAGAGRGERSRAPRFGGKRPTNRSLDPAASSTRPGPFVDRGARGAPPPPTSLSDRGRAEIRRGRPPTRRSLAFTSNRGRPASARAGLGARRRFGTCGPPCWIAGRRCADHETITPCRLPRTTASETLEQPSRRTTVPSAGLLS